MRSGALGEAVGFGLEGAVLDNRDTGAERIAYTPGALLHHVGQFVAEQLHPLQRIRLVTARGKVNIGTHREGDSADTRRLRADMDSNIGEIGAEGRFHPGADGSREGTAANAGET
jgi:hypothetical protein